MRALPALLLVFSAFGCKGETGTAKQGSSAAAKPAAAANPHVILETSHGEVELELFADKAPKGVPNFLQYGEGGRYDGPIFQRVLPGFVVQGGCFDANLERKPTTPPLENEADNGLKNER